MSTGRQKAANNPDGIPLGIPYPQTEAERAYWYSDLKVAERARDWEDIMAIQLIEQARDLTSQELRASGDRVCNMLIDMGILELPRQNLLEALNGSPVALERARRTWRALSRADRDYLSDWIVGRCHFADDFANSPVDSTDRLLSACDRIAERTGGRAHAN